MAYNYVHVAQRFSAKMKVSDLMMDPIEEHCLNSI